MYLHIKNKAKLSTPARPLNIWLFFYLDFKVCIVKKFNKNKRTKFPEVNNFQCAH